MIEIKNVTKTYAGSAVHAVDHLNFEVKSGEIFGFLGPNGAGKSTTIKMMTGILTIDDGDILMDGVSVKSAPLEAKRKIGFVPDDHAVYEKLTGREYLHFLATVYRVSKEEEESRIADLAVRFGLTEALSDRISSYSHGMRQKIVVIGALIGNPKVWILDEPLTGLDPQSAYEMKQLMRAHAEAGNTVFFSSHVIDVVEKVCDRIGIIKKGKLIEVCTLDELRNKIGDETLEQYFLRVTAENGVKEGARS